MSFFQLYNCKCSHYYASHQRTNFVTNKDDGRIVSEYTTDQDCTDCFCPEYSRASRRYKQIYERRSQPEARLD